MRYRLGGIVLALLVASCGKYPKAAEGQVYHTWHSLHELEYGAPSVPAHAEIIPQKFSPWAGIASHHVLAHEYLDGWFSQLAKLRKVKCFYILSPSHFGISLQPFSLTIGSWESGFGPVESDRDTVNRLAELLEVNLDPGMFQFEHGVSTFMPYIKKYFPKAKVAAVAYQGEAPVNVPLSGRLADVIKKEFDDKGKKENFLLISADFSHRGNPEETKRKDDYSEQFLKNSGDAFWNMVSCDNRPGMYLLDSLGRDHLEPVILYHSNSWEISGHGKDDITSYFFVYFAGKNRLTAAMVQCTKGPDSAAIGGFCLLSRHFYQAPLFYRAAPETLLLCKISAEPEQPEGEYFPARQ